ncbi:MAG: hypothetical protein ACOX5R_01270 [bacterium]
MSRKRMISIYVIILIIISLPFSIIPMLANPDDAPVTPIQHAAAALANFFGPWGVIIV